MNPKITIGRLTNTECVVSKIPTITDVEMDTDATVKWCSDHLLRYFCVGV